jgi:uncharacterized protein YjbI with pentapeptide repeats
MQYFAQSNIHNESIDPHGTDPNFSGTNPEYGIDDDSDQNLDRDSDMQSDPGYGFADGGRGLNPNIEATDPNIGTTDPNIGQDSDPGGVFDPTSFYEDFALFIPLVILLSFIWRTFQARPSEIVQDIKDGFLWVVRAGISSIGYWTRRRIPRKWVVNYKIQRRFHEKVFAHQDQPKSFVDLNLKGTMLPSGELVGVDFSYSRLSFVEWKNMILRHARFVGTDFYQAEILDSDIRGAVFGANKETLDMRQSIITLIPDEFSPLTLDQLNKEWKVANANHKRILPYREKVSKFFVWRKEAYTYNPRLYSGILFLAFINAQKARWKGDFSRSQFLEGGDFDHSVIEGNWSFTTLEKVSFRYADLRGVCFDHADLTGVDFSFADLTGATFRFAKLDGVIFIGTQLKNVQFDMADLKDLKMFASSVKGASINGVYFEGREFVYSMINWDECDRKVFFFDGNIRLKCRARGYSPYGIYEMKKRWFLLQRLFTWSARLIVIDTLNDSILEIKSFFSVIYWMCKLQPNSTIRKYPFSFFGRHLSSLSIESFKNDDLFFHSSHLHDLEIYPNGRFLATDHGIIYEFSPNSKRFWMPYDFQHDMNLNWICYGGKTSPIQHGSREFFRSWIMTKGQIWGFGLEAKSLLFSEVDMTGHDLSIYVRIVPDGFFIRLDDQSCYPAKDILQFHENNILIPSIFNHDELKELSLNMWNDETIAEALENGDLPRQDPESIIRWVKSQRGNKEEIYLSVNSLLQKHFGLTTSDFMKLYDSKYPLYTFEEFKSDVSGSYAFFSFDFPILESTFLSKILVNFFRKRNSESIALSSEKRAFCRFSYKQFMSGLFDFLLPHGEFVEYDENTVMFIPHKSPQHPLL